MKRIVCMILCTLVICALFAGCGKQQGEASDKKLEEIGEAWQTQFQNGVIWYDDYDAWANSHGKSELFYFGRYDGYDIIVEFKNEVGALGISTGMIGDYYFGLPTGMCILYAYKDGKVTRLNTGYLSGQFSDEMIAKIHADWPYKPKG